MNFNRGRQQQEISLNITPLIDVVFLLLIFFMLTTTFSSESQLSVNLPRSSTAIHSEQVPQIELAVDRFGEYYIDGQHVVNTKQSTLQKALFKVIQLRAGGNSSTTELKLIGDATAPHQAIVTAMDVAGELGLSRIQVATVKTNKGTQ